MQNKYFFVIETQKSIEWFNKKKWHTSFNSLNTNLQNYNTSFEITISYKLAIQIRVRRTFQQKLPPDIFTKTQIFTTMTIIFSCSCNPRFLQVSTAAAFLSLETAALTGTIARDWLILAPLKLKFFGVQTNTRTVDSTLIATQWQQMPIWRRLRQVQWCSV